MIRFIAALDNQNGIADDHGIPWQGKLPSDVAYFREKTLHGNVMMGQGWYQEQKLPLPDRKNLVATSQPVDLRPGFDKVTDAREYLNNEGDDVWVGGGAGLFASTLDLADELYLTRIDQDFNCTKFFPAFEVMFELIKESEPITNNEINFVFQVWKKLPKQG